MKWRKYTPEDYETIASWFVLQGWPQAPDSSILPTTGILAEDDAGPIAVAFIYLSNSPLAWLEFISTRPGLGRKGLLALEYLMGIVKEQAVALGIQKLVHLSQQKYVRTFEKRFGFIKSEDAAVLVWGVS